MLVRFPCNLNEFVFMIMPFFRLDITKITDDYIHVLLEM